MKIGTWNVHQRTNHEPHATEMASRDADLWVLTECPERLKVGATVASSGRYRNHSWGWVSIQGTDVEQVPIEFTAGLGCAALTSVGGERAVVLGSVLPWKTAHTTLDLPGEVKDDYRTTFDFVLLEHLEALRALRQAYPTLPLIWAGDFNQELSEGRCYAGADAGRQSILSALAADDLQLKPLCADQLTLKDTSATIDHVCGSAAWVVGQVERIMRPDLSDHAGYVVSVTRS